jgi:hypothetical protein
LTLAVHGVSAEPVYVALEQFTVTEELAVVALTVDAAEVSEL